METTQHKQKTICTRVGAKYCESPANLKVGIAENVKTGLQPINGLRVAPEGDTTGWYIWAGEEFSEDPEFFVPLHVSHLDEWCPRILKYLGLPPGWRFLVADKYEDIWQDDSLLE